MNKVVFFLGLIISFSVNAQIYKWVDENGVTQYSSRKPMNSEVTEMKIKDSTTPKKLSGEAKELADSFAKEIVKGSGDATKVNCDKAVFNAKDSIDTMLSVGKKNYKDGYMKESEYKKISGELQGMQRKISVSECRSSKGSVNGFYKCMSNDSNHIAHCGKKYGYGK